MLISLFNDFGFNDSYTQGFPSRWSFTREKLELMNDSEKMRQLIVSLLNPANFIDREEEFTLWLEKLNKYLAFDGFQIRAERRRCAIIRIEEDIVRIENQFDIDEFVKDQIRKCEEKLEKQDYDGAISSSRSLLEGVFAYIHLSSTGRELEKSGDLRQDFKKLRNLLRLGPEEHQDEAIRQVLNAMASLVDGIDTLSNKMGDRHRRRYRPERRHGKLVVNAAKTVADFLLETSCRRETSPS